MLTEFELQANGSTPPHFHDWEHEIYVLDGAMEIVLPDEERTEPVGTGDVIFIPRGEPHGFVTGPQGGCRFLVVAPSERPPVRSVFLSDDPYEYTQLAEYAHARRNSAPARDEGEQAEAMRIHGIFTAYLQSKAVFTALELRVFDILETDTFTMAELARTLDCPLRPVRALLIALEGLKLVKRDGERFANTAAASRLLVSSSPVYMGGFAEHQNRHFTNFARLTEAVRTDVSITQRVLKEGYRDQGAAEGEGREGTRRLHEAVRVSARLQVDQLAAAIPLDGVARLLDLGCGSADYTVAIAQAHPDLKITGVDYPAVCEIAREHVEAHGVGHQVDIQPTNIFEDPLPACDAVLLSHILDGYGTGQVQKIIAKVYDRLPKGGKVIVHSHMPSLSTSVFPSVFGLILLANTEEGEVREVTDITAWMQDAGFEKVDTRAVSPLSGLLVATK
ncbi:methyltransferase [Streptomyces collinus]|uniref:methyltransferase n=1 Tax=Streptomyces collinus TaxID=42684 RepID=UPI00380AEF3C